MKMEGLLAFGIRLHTPVSFLHFHVTNWVSGFYILVKPVSLTCCYIEGASIYASTLEFVVSFSLLPITVVIEIIENRREDACLCLSNNSL